MANPTTKLALGLGKSFQDNRMKGSGQTVSLWTPILIEVAKIIISKIDED